MRLPSRQIVTEGQKSWTFTINHAKYDDAHLFLGVADATGDGMAWAFSPSTGSLYFHVDLHKWGKETKTRIMAGDALFGRKDGPPGHRSAQHAGSIEPTAAEEARLSQQQQKPTRIPLMIDAQIKVIVDMDQQALSFQINDGDIVEVRARTEMPPFASLQAPTLHVSPSQDPQGASYQVQAHAAERLALRLAAALLTLVYPRTANFRARTYTRRDRAHRSCSHAQASCSAGGRGCLHVC